MGEEFGLKVVSGKIYILLIWNKQHENNVKNIYQRFSWRKVTKRDKQSLRYTLWKKRDMVWPCGKFWAK